MIKGADDIGQHVPHQRPRGLAAGRLCRREVVIPLDSDDGTSHHPRIGNAGGHPQHDDYLRQSLPGYGHDRQQQQQSRERHPGIDDSLHCKIQFSPEEPGRAANQRGDHHVHRSSGQPDEYRNPRPVDQAAQQVASQLVGTQKISGRGALKPVHQVQVVRFIRSQSTGKDTHDDQRKDDTPTKSAKRLLLYQSFQQHAHGSARVTP